MSISRAAALAAGLFLSAHAGEAQGLRFPPAVEPPPAAYASGPSLSGKTYTLELSSAQAVDYLCRLGLGAPPKKGGAWWGCYRPDMDAVIVPARGAWAEAERREIIAHEWAHARGWRHNANGRGTSVASLDRGATHPADRSALVVARGAP
jgi:hypothetical protein